MLFLYTPFHCEINRVPSHQERLFLHSFLDGNDNLKDPFGSMYVIDDRSPTEGTK